MHIMPLTLCGGAVVVSGAEWWYTHVAVFTTHHCGLHYSITMVGIYVAMPEMVMYCKWTAKKGKAINVVEV